jgi:hypothetical protein
MAKIGKEIIDKILDTARIEEVIQDCLGSYSSQNKAGLKKTGIRYKALCPFHDDKNLGSFVVYPKGNCYKCFSCGAKGGVVEFLMEHEKLSYPDAIRWLGKKYNIPVDDVPVDWTYTPRPVPPPLPMLELPMSMVERTQNAANADTDILIRWIMDMINWDYVQRKRISEVLNDYHVGHGKNGHTIFWQIDENSKVRTGKMMKYRADGHRDKQASWSFDFIHSVLSKHWDAERREWTDEPPYPYPDIYNPDKEEPHITFFGMHLLNRYRHATIKLVESEKTALLMAIAYGNHAKQVWMACGGLEMMTRERLKPIIDQRRRIILYPDRDGVDKWRAKAEQMHYDRLSIDARPVIDWWKPEDGTKADIADVVIRLINESKPLTTIADVKAEMPKVTKLIDKLNLKIENEEK